MPLDPLQERIARTALALPEACTPALAGGGAMIAHGFTTRQTQGHRPVRRDRRRGEAVRVAVALRRTLEEQALATRDGDRPPLRHFLRIGAARRGRIDQGLSKAPRVLRSGLHAAYLHLPHAEQRAAHPRPIVRLLGHDWVGDGLEMAREAG
jgi:hypothetical protein